VYRYRKPPPSTDLRLAPCALVAPNWAAPVAERFTKLGSPAAATSSPRPSLPMISAVAQYAGAFPVSAASCLGLVNLSAPRCTRSQATVLPGAILSVTPSQPRTRRPG
jgi:hypothetical protein